MPLTKSRSPRHREKRSRSRSRSPRYRQKTRDYRRGRSRSPYQKSSQSKRPYSTSSSSYRHNRSRSSPGKRSAPEKQTSHKHDKGSPKRYGSPESKRVSSSTHSHKPSTSKSSSTSQRRDDQSRGYSPVQKRPRSRSLSPPPPSRQDLERMRDPPGMEQERWDPYTSHKTNSPPKTLYDDYSQQRRSPSLDYKDSQLLFPAAQSVGVQDLSMVYPSEPRILIGERFNDLEDEVLRPPVLEENITIGIHRKGPAMRHDPHTPIKRGFNSRIPLTIHRKDEGRHGLFDREEIKVFHHDDVLDDDIFEEKRTISVHQPERRSRSHRSEDYSDKRIIQKPDSRKIIGTHRSSRSEATTSPKIRFDPRPDPRYESLFKIEEKFKTSYPDTSLTDRIHRNPNDLRHSLLKRRHDDDKGDSHFDARKKIEAKRKELGHKRDSRSRDKHRSGVRRSRERGQERSRSADGRRNSSDLPDFSNRPGRKEQTDKFQSPDWQDKPEMIPKNPMYYEHDNRDDDNSYRGRGGFRSRSFRARGFRGGYQGTNYKGSNYRGSSYRGSSYRPRGFRRPYGSKDYSRGSYKGTGYDSERRSHDTWKHDKYEDNKDEGRGDDKHKERSGESRTDKEEKDDNKPSSTT